jgi:hypothetical protein
MDLDPTHPTAEQLERFILGRTDAEENRNVVLHLLGSCPECRNRMRALWSRAESALAKLVLVALPEKIRNLRRQPMNDAEQAAQDELFETVVHLKSLRFRLLGVASTLPSSTPWREIVECVLVDAVEPAIRDLTTAAELAERDEEEARRTGVRLR